MKNVLTLTINNQLIIIYLPDVVVIYFKEEIYVLSYKGIRRKPNNRFCKVTFYGLMAEKGFYFG